MSAAQDAVASIRNHMKTKMVGLPKKVRRVFRCRSSPASGEELYSTERMTMVVMADFSGLIVPDRRIQVVFFVFLEKWCMP